MPSRRTPKELRYTTDQIERWWSRLVRAYVARMPHQERWEELKEYYVGNYFNEPTVEDRVSSMLHFLSVGLPKSLFVRRSLPQYGHCESIWSAVCG